VRCGQDVSAPDFDTRVQRLPVRASTFRRIRKGQATARCGAASRVKACCPGVAS
jgi:hypothetical protein